MFEQRISDEGIPTIVNMVDALDGYEDGGVVLETTEERVLDDGTVAPGHDDHRALRQARRSSTSCSTPSPARPSPTCCCSIGLALLVFEFFTAGVGIAGVVGAACLVLACTGLAALPARGWAVGADPRRDARLRRRRAGRHPPVLDRRRHRRSRSSAACWLFEPLPGVTLRPSWITLLAGIGGVVLAFVVGMPSMVRTRFATPTIGREWMIGELGEVVEAVDPDGVVSVGDGPLAGPHQPGDAGRRRRAGAGRRHRRRHAGGRAAGGRRPRPPRAPHAAPSD